jgi:hypothetical protein
MKRRKCRLLPGLAPSSLGRLQTGVGREDLGSNLTERKRPSVCDRRRSRRLDAI